VNLEEGYLPAPRVTATYHAAFDTAFDTFMETKSTRVLQTYGGYGSWAGARFTPNDTREHDAFAVEAQGHYVAQSTSTSRRPTSSALPRSSDRGPRRRSKRARIARRDVARSTRRARLAASRWGQ
jgi:hypothetical protein